MMLLEYQHYIFPSQSHQVLRRLERWRRGIDVHRRDDSGGLTIAPAEAARRGSPTCGGGCHSRRCCLPNRPWRPPPRPPFPPTVWRRWRWQRPPPPAVEAAAAAVVRVTSNAPAQVGPRQGDHPRPAGAPVPLRVCPTRLPPTAAAVGTSATAPRRPAATLRCARCSATPRRSPPRAVAIELPTDAARRAPPAASARRPAAAGRPHHRHAPTAGVVDAAGGADPVLDLDKFPSRDD